MSKVILSCCLVTLLLDSYFCWVITEINSKMLAQGQKYKNDISDDETDVENDGIFERINLIYPGTKWCGAGNVADSYDDLGIEKEADMCCRDHDNCPDVIPGGETRHNLTNEAFYSRLSCTCDNTFQKCLKEADTKVARYIGSIYFNALQTKCYREDYPAECSKKAGWFNTKCVEYTYDTSKNKTYQWFDVEDF